MRGQTGPLRHRNYLSGEALQPPLPGLVAQVGLEGPRTGALVAGKPKAEGVRVEEPVRQGYGLGLRGGPQEITAATPERLSERSELSEGVSGCSPAGGARRPKAVRRCTRAPNP